MIIKDRRLTLYADLDGIRTATIKRYINERDLNDAEREALSQEGIIPLAPTGNPLLGASIATADTVKVTMIAPEGTDIIGVDMELFEDGSPHALKADADSTNSNRYLGYANTDSPPFLVPEEPDSSTRIRNFRDAIQFRQEHPDRVHELSEQDCASLVQHVQYAIDNYPLARNLLHTPPQ